MLDPQLREVLELKRCPHCRIDIPNLTRVGSVFVSRRPGNPQRFWANYECARCAGVILAESDQEGGSVSRWHPTKTAGAFASVPSRARTFLEQAQDSIHAPDGAIMLCASAVDSMLKAEPVNLKEGSLDHRIGKAAEIGHITEGMSDWAHAVRLEANDSRHPDTYEAPPAEADAKQSIEFVEALAQFLFELPSRVTRGLAAAKKSGDDPSADAEESAENA